MIKMANNRCVLAKLPCVYTHIKLPRSEWLHLLKKQLSSFVSAAVCTVHECKYFDNQFALSVILRRAFGTATLKNSGYNVHCGKPKPSAIVHDFSITVSVRCAYLGLNKEEVLFTLQLRDFWESLHNGMIQAALCKKLFLQNLGTKSYIKCLYSMLDMYQHCARGLYKVSLTCAECNKKHRVLLSHTT